MYEEWRREGEKTGLMLLKQTEYYVGTDQHLKIYESHPDVSVCARRANCFEGPGLSRTGQFLINAMSDLKLGFPADHSIAFTSLTMTPLVYLNRLLVRIAQLGGHIHRCHVPSLAHISHPSTTALIGLIPPSHVVACVGLGALTLGGIEDRSVYPTRGQVVKVRAPWVRSGWTRQVGSLDGGEGGERTYVIPRPDGEVILGGTREENDWNPYPREETCRNILRRAMEICPALQPAHQRALALAIDDIGKVVGESDADANADGTPLSELVVAHLVGFRPSRTGGVRLEMGHELSVNGDGQGTKVAYNYGHGGAGWQSCWGTADDAAKLVLESL